jgi:hypothetical protein
MTVKKTLIYASLALCSVAFAPACTSESTKTSEPAQPVVKTDAQIVEHGKYLVGIMGCNDCHSPKRMGANGPELIPELLLSGYPSDRPVVKFDSKLIKEGFAMFYPDLTAGAGPWGLTFAANLTPDDTGIGSWTKEQFKKALTEGKYKGLDGGRVLLPPMPWVNYIGMTDEDVTAVFMYLKSIQPVKNVVPAPITPDQM